MRYAAGCAGLAVLVAALGMACGGGGGGGDGGPRPGPFEVDAATIALWHFDEGGGQIARDASANQYDLLLGPTAGGDAQDPYWAPGRFGDCLHFVAAEGDYATASHAIAPLPGASIELWTRTIVPDGVLFNAGFINFQLSWATAGQLWFGIGDGGTWDSMRLDSSWGTVITNGQWHYLAATYDGTTLRVYVDGQEGGSAVSGRMLAQPNELHVGGRPSNTFVAGDIDEVRFSRGARGSDEIAAYWERNQP